jgi:hypothetical protein
LIDELSSKFQKTAFSLRFVCLNNMADLLNSPIKMIGTVKNNQYFGKGKLVSEKTGKIFYDGVFYDNLYHGIGTLSNPKTSSEQVPEDWYQKIETCELWKHYEGKFISGMPEGRGTLVMNNGDYLISEFTRGRINGEGKVFFSDGTTFSGIWCDNELEDFQ